MINSKNRQINQKNYIIAVVLFVGIILFTFYIFKWYQVFNTEKITKSYLISSNVIANEINSLDELSDVLSEAPLDYFLYISYPNDKKIYNMEIDLKKVICKYELQDKFYYLNIEDIKENEDYIEELNSILNLNEEKITNVPTILYFKEHTLAKNGIIHKDNNTLMQASDFNQLLENLKIEKP